MDIMKCFPDPDEVGQSEYRAIHDCLKDTLEDCPKKERFDLAMSMLDEFELWAKSMKSNLEHSPKKPKG